MMNPLFLEPQPVEERQEHVQQVDEDEMWHALVRLSEYYDLEPKKTQRPHRKNFYRKSQ